MGRTKRLSWTLAAFAATGVLVAEAEIANARFAGDPQLEAVAAGTATLHYGSSGNGVLEMKQALMDMGFFNEVPKFGTVAADFSFHSYTRHSVENFQRHLVSAFPGSVSVNGVVDSKTLAELSTLAPPPGQRGEVDFNPNLGIYGGKRIRCLVIKNEHRTILFDAQGTIAGTFCTATGTPRRGNNYTYAGLFRVGDFGVFTNFRDGAALLVPADPRMSAKTRKHLETNPELILGAAPVNGGGAQGPNGSLILFGYDNAPNGWPTIVHDDMKVLLAHLHRGDKVAIVESLRDRRIGR